MVVVLEYVFFRLYSNAEQISVRLARFRRSYVNRPGVVLTNHTSYTAFLLDVRCAVRSGRVPFFLQLFVPNDSTFAYSKAGKQTKRCQIVIHKYIKTNR